jgi:hypothetical protein
LKKSALTASMVMAEGRRATVAIFSSLRSNRYRDQLGKFAEAFGCDVELVFFTSGTWKMQVVEL